MMPILWDRVFSILFDARQRMRWREEMNCTEQRAMFPLGKLSRLYIFVLLVGFIVLAVQGSLCCGKSLSNLCCSLILPFVPRLLDLVAPGTIVLWPETF